MSNHDLIEDLTRYTKKPINKEINKNKTTPDLFKNRNPKDKNIQKIENIDLDKQ